MLRDITRIRVPQEWRDIPHQGFTRPTQELTRDDLKSFFWDLLKEEMGRIEEKIVNLEEKIRESHKAQRETQRDQENQVLDKIRMIMTL